MAQLFVYFLKKEKKNLSSPCAIAAMLITVDAQCITKE